MTSTTYTIRAWFGELAELEVWPRAIEAETAEAALDEAIQDVHSSDYPGLADIDLTATPEGGDLSDEEARRRCTLS